MIDDASARAVVCQAIARWSYQTGDFKLSAGGRSNYIIDLSKSLRRGDVLQYVAQLLPPIPFSLQGVGGPSFGADPLAAAVLRVRPDMYWFSVRHEPKDHGFDAGLVTGPVRSGDSVLLVEDVVTSGKSLLRAAYACLDYGLGIGSVLCCVDREEGGLQFVRQALGGRCLRDVECRALFTKSEIVAAHEALQSDRGWVMTRDAV